MVGPLSLPIFRAAVVVGLGLLPTRAAAGQTEGTPAPADTLLLPAPTERPAAAPPPAVPGHKLFPLPILFYQPETKLGGGVGLLHTYRTALESRISSNGLFAVVTQRRQYSISLSGELYTAGNRWRLATWLGWSRFPNFFYGIGNDTRAEDEEAFTPAQVGVGLDVRRSPRPGLYVGMLAIYQETRIVASEPAGAIGTHAVPGSSGGTLVGIGVSVMLDDRDRVYTPRRGRVLSVVVGRYDGLFGSDFELWRGELDVRYYRALGKRQTLAMHFVTTVTSGTPAFYDNAALGGPNVLRGYYEGRYRDRSRLVAQLEHRSLLWKRIGGAVFLGAGEVAGDLGDLRLDGFHVAGGAGLRWLVSPADGVNLRVDVGIGNGDSGLYFAFGDAF